MTDIANAQSGIGKMMPGKRMPGVVEALPERGALQLQPVLKRAFAQIQGGRGFGQCRRGHAHTRLQPGVERVQGVE